MSFPFGPASPSSGGGGIGFPGSRFPNSSAGMSDQEAAMAKALRAKNDIKNGIAAGCVTGGILAAKAGPQAAAVGCAGFAAFSAAIETYLRMPGD
ncbi:Mitochondrial import inner membrane translocase subunit tim22 [Thelotrema lepadinum]|nr:Mitochondrial import inner membrane translocase subunit tim22 [Thelotrema lepadinum]